MPVLRGFSPRTAAASGCAKQQQPLAAAALGSGGSGLLRRLLPPLTTPLSRAAKDLVSRNHRYHHIFFNHELFHNHLAHHVVAVEALGCEELGSACRFNELWAAYDSYLTKKPPLRADVDINAANWKNWLGDHSCYSNYLEFFAKQIKENSILETAVKYVFDPACLPRLFGGVFHPLIHLGYAVEALDDEIAAEALALTALEVAEFQQTVDLLDPNLDRSRLKPISDILKDIRADRNLDSVVQYTDEDKTRETLANATMLTGYLNQWTVDEDEEDVVRKLSELHDAAAMMLFASSRPGHPKAPQLDFFLMHVLTSSFALRQLVPHLELAQVAQLLRIHFATAVVYYVARGRPELTPSYLATYPAPDSWAELARGSFTHDDAHVPKVVHALKVFEGDCGAMDNYRRGAQMLVDALVKNKRDWNFKGMFDEMWDDPDVKACL